MSIGNHKWSDEEIDLVFTEQEDPTVINIFFDGKVDSTFISKADSQAIAKHFNQDLVTKIKELIDEYKGYVDAQCYDENSSFTLKSVCETLQDLIKELDDEKT